jgi:hypothetical protein
MQKQTKFIVFIIAVILIIGGIGAYFSLKTQVPGKLDGFAQAIKASGAEFYGAFWCPHCQEQKALFGTSKKYLPYVECSNPDQSQTQICIDKKIESYPSWTFKDAINITSKENPTICEIAKEGVTQQGVCQNAESQYFKTWVFPSLGFSVKSPTDPVKNGDIWQFPSDAMVVGKLSLEFLAKESKVTLPQ